MTATPENLRTWLRDEIERRKQSVGMCWTCGTPRVPRIERPSGDGIARMMCARCVEAETEDTGGALAVVVVIAVVVIVAWVVASVVMGAMR